MYGRNTNESKAQVLERTDENYILQPYLEIEEKGKKRIPEYNSQE